MFAESMLQLPTLYYERNGYVLASFMKGGNQTKGESIGSDNYLPYMLTSSNNAQNPIYFLCLFRI